jgi:hypothetical protein
MGGYFKIGFKEIECGGVDLIHVVQDESSGRFCEHGNGPWGFTNGGDFLIS